MDEQDPNKQNPAPQNGAKVVDEYQAASRATAQEEYDDYSTKPHAYSAPAHHGRKIALWLLVILLLAAAGFGAYWFLVRKDNTKTASKTTGQTSHQATTQNTENNTISSETKHYVSQGFGLEFDYPSDWTVAEEQGAGVLTATSPAMQLKSPEAKPITGQIVFKIRNKQQPLPEFDKGNAVASLASEKIDYTKPSSAQRGSTYLSFLRYASSSAVAALDGVYITGDVGYQNGQAIPKADFVPVDPIISITFNKCSDSSCSGDKTTITGIDNDQWQQESFAGPLRNMLKSLIVN